MLQRRGEKKNSGTFLPWDFHLRASVYLERAVEDNLKKKKKNTQNLKFLSCWLQNERSFPFLIGTDFFHICEDNACTHMCLKTVMLNYSDTNLQ